MISNKQTADIVRGIVLRNPFLVDYLRRDLLNVAQLSRELLPAVKRQNQKATVESIAVAINRLELKGGVSKQLASLVTSVQLSVRTGIALVKLSRKAPDAGMFSGDDVFFLHQSTDHITVIVDEKNINGLHRTVSVQRDLGLLSIRDTQAEKSTNYRVTPGFIHTFVSNISSAGINIVDVVTGSDTVNFVLAERDLMEAFAICEGVRKSSMLASDSSKRVY